MDARRTRSLLKLVVTGLVVLGLGLWLVTRPVPPPPQPAVGPAEAPASAVAAPGPAPAAAARPAEAPPGSAPAARPRLPAGVRARAVAPDARRVMLAAILGKIAKREAGARSAAPAGGAQPAAGSLSKEYIQQQVREIVPLVKECYEMALQDSPELSGDLKVRFTIAGDEDYGGLVVDSQVLNESSLAGQADLVECVRETMYAIRLDAPEGGGQVVVNYPFRFASSPAREAEAD